MQTKSDARKEKGEYQKQKRAIRYGTFLKIKNIFRVKMFKRRRI